MTKLMLTGNNPVVGISVVLAAGFLCFQGFKWLVAKTAGWKNLVEKFPASGTEQPGDTFKNLSGWIGNIGFNRFFTLQLNSDGLFVRPNFAKRQPILIPWSKVTEVTASDVRIFGFQQNLHLTVAWEKQLVFSLPAGALPLVERYLPSERLRRTGSPMDQSISRPPQAK